MLQVHAYAGSKTLFELSFKANHQHCHTAKPWPAFESPHRSQSNFSHPPYTLYNYQWQVLHDHSLITCKFYSCANNYYKTHSPQVVILCMAACVTLCQLFACWITSMMHGPLHPGPFWLAWEGCLVQQPAQYTLHNNSTLVYWALKARWTKEDNLSSLLSPD